MTRSQMFTRDGIDQIIGSLNPSVRRRPRGRRMLVMNSFEEVVLKDGVVLET